MATVVADIERLIALGGGGEGLCGDRVVLVVAGGKGDILRYLPARRLSSDSLKGQCQTGQGKNCSFLHFVVLRVDEGADLLSFNELLQVAYDIHVEDVDRQLVVLAHADSGEVHDLQSAL